MENRELVKTWKVQVTAKGVMLKMNGREYELGSSAPAIVFALERAAAGYTVPERIGNESPLNAQDFIFTSNGCRVIEDK